MQKKPSSEKQTPHVVAHRWNLCFWKELTCVCAHVYVHVSIHMCMWQCECMCVYVHLYVCGHVCVWICAYMWECCVCTLAQCLHTCVGHESRKGTLKWKDEILGELKRIKRNNELHRPWRRKVGLIQERKEERWGRRDRGSLKVSKWLVQK